MASTTNHTPPLLDLTIDNITENVVRINSQSSNARLNYLMERLVTHVHDFARETRLSTHEWMATIEFLTKTGQMCTDVRQVCYLFLSFDIIKTSASFVSGRPAAEPAGIYSGCRSSIAWSCFVSFFHSKLSLPAFGEPFSYILLPPLALSRSWPPKYHVPGP